VYTLGSVRQVPANGISSGLLSVNVAASVKAPRKQHSQAVVDARPKDEPWPQEELLQFRAVADQDEWAACWRLTLCGLRRSEIMGMQWDCVDLDHGEVKVEHGRVLLDGNRTATDDPKSTASRRTVPVEEIQPGTVALLRALKARQAADRLLLGNWVRGDARRSARPACATGVVLRSFPELCTQAGVRTIHLHLVRHTLAVEMIRAGVAIVDGAALLGHTPDVFVSTYLRKSESGARSAARVLGAALASGS
jgi:integrase